jgi:hypothetical protein
MRNARDEDEDLDEIEDYDDLPDFPETPTGRTYVHKKCRGETHVSGGDFSHICDPIWPCTGTFCCTCNGFAPLREVRWADTGEPVSDYRNRLLRKTPMALKLWRFGGGFLAGGAVGAGIAMIIAALGNVPADKLGGHGLIGGLIGAVLVYFIGSAILSAVYKIDYCRMR